MTTAPAHVYVHVPFCARRCSYCDFSIAVRRSVPVDEFLGGLRRELTIRLGASSVASRRSITTLYFGGGTPSHLGADGVARLLDLMREWFVWDAMAEVTLEANPDDVTVASTRAWLAAGVTRVSLGAQSFEPQVLEWMHRSHSVGQIVTAVELLHGEEFASWSFDLIFALPASLGRVWERDLERSLALRPPHLSLYGLTVEQGTPLARWAERGEVTGADEQAYEQEFLGAHAAAVAAGFEHYEVSNFAQPGHQARHNRSYWRGVPYVGLGPSAHGFDGHARRWNVAAYAAWLARLEVGSDPLGGSEAIAGDAGDLEAIYLGLRTSDGLAVTAREHAIVTPWITAGWAEIRRERVTLTPHGWLRLDSLAAALTPVRGSR